MQDMQEIIIGGRTIPLLLTTLELISVQKEIGCTVAQLRDEVFGVTEDEEPGKNGKAKFRMSVATDPKRMQKLGTLIRIMGNAGLEEMGQEQDLTDKGILRNIKPGMVLPVALVIMAAINDAMMMETAEEKKNESTEPVDVMIEEENRKKEPRK